MACKLWSKGSVFFTGILILRALSQQDYALYTIANTMQGTMSLLSDTGISAAVSALGGKVWQDRQRLGEVIQSALKLRRVFACISIILVAPVAIFLLVRQGASYAYAFALLGLVLTGLIFQINAAILVVVPRFYTRVKQLQNIEFFTAVVRLLGVGMAYLTYLNSLTTIFVSSFIACIQWFLVRKEAGRVIDFSSAPTADDSAEIKKVAKSMAPNVIFYCVQGQIAVWLISVFGSANSIAEVGALGRLAAIFAIISSIQGNIILPRFARSSDLIVVKKRYWQIFLVTSCIALGIFIVAIVSPKLFLTILGPKYVHLTSELPILVASVVMNFVVASAWTMNCSRGWVTMSWLTIPITITSQVVMLPFLDLATVKGVIWFGFVPTLPLLVLNLAMGVIGMRSTRTIYNTQ